MPRFEYKVIPAPKKARRVKGVKSAEGRFAHALTELMNEMGAEGYEYVRADSLPCEERGGFGSRRVETQNMLVFRKTIETGATAETIVSAHLAQAERAPEPEAYAAPQPVAQPVSQPAPQPAPEPVQHFEPMRRAEPAYAPEPHPEDRQVANTIRPALRLQPEPVAAPSPEAPVTMPSFRSAKVESREPVFSRSLEGRTPRLGGARHSDDR